MHDYKAETASLIATLQKHGFTITFGSNGGARFPFSEGPAFIEELTACDEGDLYATGADQRKVCIYLVLGNEPGMIACDHTDTDDLGAAIDEHYDNFNKTL